MADILGMGTCFNFKGRISGYYYEGLLFNKSDTRTTHYDNGTHYVIDVKEVNETEVTDAYDVIVFNNDEIPIAKLTGEQYLVIEGKPRFGRILTLADLKG